MSRPPKDTHGPIVKTGPTRGQNRSRNKDGSWRAKRNDAGQARTDVPLLRREARNLSSWFWGTILVLAIATIALVAAASLNRTEEVKEQVSSPDADDLRDLLDPAVKAALEKAESQVDGMVDEAFVPAYAAIPTYADFHYSVLGEYAELTAAALGQAEEKLRDTLYEGLDDRLATISPAVSQVFLRELETGLQKALVEMESLGMPIMPLKDQIIKSTKQRMAITVPASVATIAGAKVAATAAAKAIAKKLAVKAAAKTGGKLGIAATGAVTGAAVCAWAGPGASACAAVGGVAAWFATDYAIIKLDEYWSRDEFEADLKSLVDEQRAKMKKAFHEAMSTFAVDANKRKDEFIKDFKLFELYDPALCAFAAELIALYDPMRENLRARNPTEISALHKSLDPKKGHPVLGTLVKEIEDNLTSDPLVRITSIEVSGNLPLEDRADRDLSGWMDLNGKRHLIEHTAATKDGFEIILDPQIDLQLVKPFSFALGLEQHNLGFNRYFGSASTLEPFKSADLPPGLSPEVLFSTFIARDTDADSVEAVTVFPTFGELLSIRFKFEAAPLAPISIPANCNS